MEEIIIELIKFYKEIIKQLSEDQKELYCTGYIDRGDVYDKTIKIYNEQIIDLIKLGQYNQNNKY